MSANETGQEVTCLRPNPSTCADDKPESPQAPPAYRGDIAKHEQDYPLLAVAAHEIRTPLNALRIQLQLAVDSLRGRDDVPHDLAQRLTTDLWRSIESAQRIARLIDDFTDIALAQEGRLRIERKHLELVALIDEVIQRMRRLHTPCPPIQLISPETLFGMWDPTRLEQVISNLLNNAVRFSSGNPIEVVAQSNNTTARIEVRDHGIGIPLEQHARIFEPFESAERLSRSHFGLGLWIVRQTVDAMGGSISILSQPGAGSTFIVELPQN
jgi:signal transduction histidine kinase